MAYQHAAGKPIGQLHGLHAGDAALGDPLRVQRAGVRLPGGDGRLGDGPEVAVAVREPRERRPPARHLWGVDLLKNEIK